MYMYFIGLGQRSKPSVPSQITTTLKFNEYLLNFCNNTTFVRMHNATITKCVCQSTCLSMRSVKCENRVKILI